MYEKKKKKAPSYPQPRSIFFLEKGEELEDHLVVNGATGEERREANLRITPAAKATSVNETGELGQHFPVTFSPTDFAWKLI